MGTQISCIAQSGSHKGCNEVSYPQGEMYSQDNEPTIITQNNNASEDMTGLVVEKKPYNREDDLRRLDSVNKAEKAAEEAKRARKAARKKAKETKKEVRRAKKEIIKETELLEICKLDLVNGTVNGLKKAKHFDIYGFGQVMATILGVASAVSLLTAPSEKYKLLKGSLIGLGQSAILFGATMGLTALSYKIICKTLDNPNNKERLEYIRDLPETIEKHEKKVANLNKFLTDANKR